MRAKVRAAIDRGVAVFASEWGTSDAAGKLGPLFPAAEAWLAFVDEQQITEWKVRAKPAAEPEDEPGLQPAPSLTVDRAPGLPRASDVDVVTPRGMLHSRLAPQLQCGSGMTPRMDDSRRLSQRISLVWPVLLSAAVLLTRAPVLAAVDSSTVEATKGGEDSTAVFASGGVGWGDIGPMALASLSAVQGSLIGSIRTSIASDFEIFGPPERKIWEVSVLFGKAWRAGATSGHVQTGLGWARTSLRGRQVESSDTWFPSYEISEHSTLNVPLQAGVGWDLRYVGIGFALVGNLNPSVADVGAVVTMTLGKIR